MVYEKLSWRNCKCPVDLWEPGQIFLLKFHPSKNPAEPKVSTLLEIFIIYTPNHISENFWVIYEISDDYNLVAVATGKASTASIQN